MQVYNPKTGEWTLASEGRDTLQIHLNQNEIFDDDTESSVTITIGTQAVLMFFEVITGEFKDFRHVNYCCTC